MEQQDFGWLQATVAELRVQLAKEQAKTLRYFEMVRTLEANFAQLEDQFKQLIPWAITCPCGGKDEDCARALEDAAVWARYNTVQDALKMLKAVGDE